MSNVVKITVPNDLKVQMQERAESLGITIPEYLRTLANLDIVTTNYQELAIYINILYNRIVDYQKVLNIQCMPLQEIPIIKMEELS